MATQAVAPRETKPTNQIELFQSQLETRAREIESALPAHISKEKFQRTIMTAVAQDPDLLKADRQSLILACYKAAQDALLPDKREAAFVIFNSRKKIEGQWQSVKEVQYMPMVYGLRKKILQSGDVVTLEVNVVYRAEQEAGKFLYEVGLEPPLRHRPVLDLSDEDAADENIICAYSIATMKDGTKSYEIMPRRDINKIRQMSQTGATGRTNREGDEIKPKGPWVDWFAEMAKKSVMRRHAKTLPMSGDLMIDVEGRELETTARALGSVAPDAPQIEDHSEDPPHDAETGEITEDQDAEREPTPGETYGLDGDQEEQGETVDIEVNNQGSEDLDARVEQPSDEPHPGAVKADELIGKFKKAELLADLKSIRKDAEKDIAAMPEDIASAVDAAFKKEEKRLARSQEAE